MNIQKTLELALQYHNNGHLSEAEGCYRKVLEDQPDQPDALHYLGVIAHQSGNNGKAVKLITKALAIKPDYTEAHNNLGLVLQQLGKLDAAAASFEEALAHKPDSYEALTNLGNAQEELGLLDAAYVSYQKALAINPDDPELLSNLGILLRSLGRPDQTATCYRKVLAINPGDAGAHNNLGNSLKALGQLDAAVASFRNALTLKPDFYEAHTNLGNALEELGSLDDAIASHRKALAIKPDFVNAWNNLASALRKTGALEEVADCYRRSLKIDPNHHASIGNYFNLLMNTCNWDEMAGLVDRFDSLNQRALKDNERVPENPLSSLTRSPDMEINYQISQSHSAHISRSMADIGVSFDFGNRRISKPKITIGYLSYDFRKHPVAHLMRQMFALHDRKAFRIIGYSSGPDDGSEHRQEIIAGCDDFVNIREMAHVEAAQRIYDDKVDILIDLNGFTKGSRLEIAALRPAPIQIHYLGFPGTTGSDFFDYIILDPVVVSKKEEKNFSEKILYIPRYFTFVSRPTEGKPKSLTREEAGLPEKGIVFCSFNKANKIEPLMFDRWINLLKKTPGSFLWLIDDNSVATGNLKREAGKRDVDPSRLIFAGKVPSSEHMARLQLADIALDTRIYNGHATTSDALWAGVPVIALHGDHVPSRASSSMLTTLGVTELITENLDAYETLALRLANDPVVLQRFKSTISKKVRTETLFDTGTAVKYLENVYRQVWDDFVNGKEAR